MFGTNIILLFEETITDNIDNKSIVIENYNEYSGLYIIARCDNNYGGLSLFIPKFMYSIITPFYGYANPYGMDYKLIISGNTENGIINIKQLKMDYWASCIVRIYGCYN